MWFQVIVCVWFAGVVHPQRPNLDNRRHDVYVAGFFPFGKGVENSDTGKKTQNII